MKSLEQVTEFKLSFIKEVKHNSDKKSKIN